VLGQHEGTGRLLHGDLDVLSLAGALAVKESGRHGLRDDQPAHLVGKDRGQQGGMPPDPLHHVGHATGRLDDVVVSRLVRLRAVQREALRLAVDDIALHRGQGLVIKAQPDEHLRPHGGHDDITRRDKPVDDAAASLRLEVEIDRPLVPQ
jgi:hypothetical protein